MIALTNNIIWSGLFLAYSYLLLLLLWLLFAPLWIKITEGLMGSDPIYQSVDGLDHVLLWTLDYLLPPRQCLQNSYQFHSVPLWREHSGITLLQVGSYIAQNLGPV